MVVEDLPGSTTADFSCEDDGTELCSDEQHRMCLEINKPEGYCNASPDVEASASPDRVGEF